MPAAPPELEARAERAVRRGELLHALELYEALLAERPEDERIRQRMDSVRALLQPSELIGRRRTEPDELQLPDEGVGSLSDAEQGEMHASSGRFQDAVACYERALGRAPSNELLRERLEELKRLAKPFTLAREDGLDRAEKLEPFTPPAVARVRGQPPPATPPARAASTPPSRPAGATAVGPATSDGASRATLPSRAATAPPARPANAPPSRPPAPPRTAPASALPRDPVQMLQALLARVQSHPRRGPATRA